MDTATIVTANSCDSCATARGAGEKSVSPGHSEICLRHVATAKDRLTATFGAIVPGVKKALFNLCERHPHGTLLSYDFTPAMGRGQ